MAARASAEPRSYYNNSVEAEEFVRWADSVAVRLDTVNWRFADLSPLTFLDSLLSGKRIVFLGEPDHYVQEKYPYRLLMLRFLHSRGFRWIGIESPFRTGNRVDRFLQTGDSADLFRIPQFGYMGATRTDRVDSAIGGAAYFNCRWMVDFGFAECRFVLTLADPEADWNANGSGWRWFGFDLEDEPGCIYEDIDSLLSPYSGDRLVKAIRRKIRIVKGESLAREIKRIGDAITFLNNHDSSDWKQFDAVVPSTLGDLMHGLHESLIFYTYLTEGDNSKKAYELAFKRREAFMCRRLKSVLDALGPDEKVVLLGHNFHLNKDSRYLEMPQTFQRHWQTVGSFADSAYPGEVYAIWMTYDKGWHYAQFCGEDSCYVQSNMFQFEYILSKVPGNCFLLPLQSSDTRTRLLDFDLVFGVGGDIAFGQLRRQTDLLFFVRQISPIPRFIIDSSDLEDSIRGH